MLCENSDREVNDNAAILRYAKARRAFKVEHFSLNALRLLIIIGHAVSLALAASHLWGEPINLSRHHGVPMFEMDLHIERSEVEAQTDKDIGPIFVDVIYPETGKKNNYQITSILALDELNADDTEAIILAGGIGFNFTMVRFLAKTSDIKYNFVIYGLPTDADL